VRASNEQYLAPCGRTHRVDEFEVFEQDGSWMHHQQKRGHHDGKRWAIAEGMPGHMFAQIYVILDQICEASEHGSELERVAEPQARPRTLNADEDRPTSFAKGERNRYDRANARVNDDCGGADGLGLLYFLRGLAILHGARCTGMRVSECGMA